MLAAIYSTGSAAAVFLTPKRYQKRALKKSFVPPIKSSAPDAPKSIQSRTSNPENEPCRPSAIALSRHKLFDAEPALTRANRPVAYAQRFIYEPAHIPTRNKPQTNRRITNTKTKTRCCAPE